MDDLDFSSLPVAAPRQTEYRVLLLHAKSALESEIREIMAKLKAALEPHHPNTQILAARNEFPKAGGWQAWTNFAALGRLPGGEPNYHALVVLGDGLIVGKSTADIVRTTLDAASRPVYVVFNGRLRVVKSLRDLGGRSFVASAVLVVE